MSSSEVKFNRPIVSHLTNSGKLTVKLEHPVEFPDDIVEQLNTYKEAMIVMQVIREDEAGNLYPEPLPPYPVDPLSTKKDIDTGKVVPEVE